MICPIAVYLTDSGELCTEDNPRQAFVVVGKGCYIADADAERHGLEGFLASLRNPAPPIPEGTKIVPVAPAKRGKK